MTDRMIFVNLPIADAERSRRFFSELGFAINEEFCSANTVCVQFGSSAFAMLLEQPFFSRFIDGEIAGAEAGTQVLTALSAASPAEVDELYERALAAGGSAIEISDPVEDERMHARSFRDPDGHVWELIHMEIG